MFLLILILPIAGIDFTMHSLSGMLIIYTIFASISGMVVYWKNRLVNRFLIIFLGSGSFVGGALGSALSGLISNKMLTAIFAVLSLIAVVSMLKKPVPTNTPPYQNKILAITIGLGIGTLGGLFGLGAGFLYVPIMMKVFNIQLRPAIGSGLCIQLALVFGALLGALTVKAGVTSFPWVEGVAVALGGITGAQVGSILGGRMNTSTLRYIMAAAITVISVKMWVDILSG
jgi:uncharacterized membrane protein YfcA